MTRSQKRRQRQECIHLACCQRTGRQRTGLSAKRPVPHIHPSFLRCTSTTRHFRYSRRVTWPGHVVCVFFLAVCIGQDLCSGDVQTAAAVRCAPERCGQFKFHSTRRPLFHFRTHQILQLYTSLFTQSVATTKMISKNKDALSVSGAIPLPFMAALRYAIVTRALMCTVYRFTPKIIWFYMCFFSRFIANCWKQNTCSPKYW